MTSFDVARLAGVSQSTVSRALRNLPNISPEVRARVARAAAQLNYVPHESARSLSTRVTRRIAVVSEALTNPFYPELLEPLRMRLGDHGYRVVLVSDSEDDALTASTLTDGSYDGVIITTAHYNSSLPDKLRERGVPCVLVNRTTGRADEHACQFANTRGAALVADLLQDLGHTRIGVIAGPQELSTSTERERGLRDALASHGLATPDEYLRRVPFSAAEGRAAALELLRLPDRPTALVCGNDYLAFGAMNAARSLSLSVPADLTVIGFDDVSMASWDTFDLTTIRCDLDELALVAVEMITRLIRGLRTETQQHVDVQLIHRGTHGTARHRK